MPAVAAATTRGVLFMFSPMNNSPPHEKFTVVTVVTLCELPTRDLLVIAKFIVGCKKAD